jgi:propanol-preferring alcohol dehydrogenase
MATPKIPEKMRAAQVVDVSSTFSFRLLSLTTTQYNKPYKIQEIPTPTELAPNDLLIRVAVASLCHTDCT